MSVNRSPERGEATQDLSTTCGMRREIAAAVIIVLVLMTGIPAGAQTGNAGADPLSRGISLYKEKRNEEALAELRRAREAERTRVLANYYYARIHCRKGEFLTARKGLLAALADSADFHDATGLLAWVNVKLGNTTDAIIEWRRFVAAVGEITPGEKITPRVIILPEEYRRRYAEAHPNAAPAPARTDSLAATAHSDTLPTAASLPATVGQPDSAGPQASAAMSDLDRRLESQIRRGYYGVGVAVALLVAGLAGTAWWMRKRRKATAGKDFLSEVDRAIDESGERDEFALGDEEIAERELRQRVRQLRAEESGTPEPPREIPGAAMRIPAASFSVPREPEPEYLPYYENFESTPAFSPDFSTPKESSRPLITEEVKALVTRLHHEGRSIVDIARLADLTRTEVELILAVRSRNVEQLVELAVRPADEPEPGAFHQAVAELSAEGRNSVEIARRLGVSTSEVMLALAVMDRKWKGRGRR